MASTKLILKDPSLLRDAAYINGDWIGTVSGETFTVVDPSDGAVIATLPEMATADVVKAIEHANAAFKGFKRTTARERARMLRRWNDLMLQNVDDLAAIMTLENGKCLADAKGEVVFSAAFFEWYAGEAERTYGETIPSANPNTRILTIKQPIGVVAAMVPWNFPAAMVARKVGAAIAAGCTAIVKPAGETPLTSLAMAVLAERAGIPAGVFNVVLVGNKNLGEVGKVLCESPGVKKVSFTGSVSVVLYICR
jgi:succinate-semialdehyde dehydrogenase/glutarate-semialdehyde dehydrogenase